MRPAGLLAAALAALCVFAAVCISRPAGAARVVIVSYTCYHKLRDGTFGDESKVAHLYSVQWRRHKLHLRQITFGDLNDDTDPVLSPDSKWMLFARSADLCLMRLETGKIRVLKQDSDSESWSDADWSPDGKYISYIASSGYDDKHPRFVVMDTQGTQLAAVSDVEEVKWRSGTDAVLATYPFDPIDVDPASHLSTDFIRSRIISFGRGGSRSTPVGVFLADFAWLSADTLIGVPDTGRSNIVVASSRGKIIRRIPVPDGIAGYLSDYIHDGYKMYNFLEWHRVPHRPDEVVATVNHHFSDGPYDYSSYLISLHSGTIRYLGDYEFCCFSGAGDSIYVSGEHISIGPYLAADVEAGPLKLLSLKTGKARLLTSPNSDIEGGDSHL